MPRLKANRASGSDQINVNILRKCPNVALPLTPIFNFAIQTGMLPQDWRYAHVSPIHKKGSRTKSGHYRPVSLTSQVVKLTFYPRVTGILAITVPVKYPRAPYDLGPQCSLMFLYGTIADQRSATSALCDHTVQITFIFIDFRVCDFAFAFKTQNAPCASRFKRVLFSDRFQFAF